jgi:poly(A) polymerase
MGVLLHDVGKPPTFSVADRIRFNGHVEEGVRMAHAILHRLRFSRDDMEQVEALVANHMKFKDAGRMKESTLKRFLRLPKFAEHLELHRLDCLSSHRNLANYEMARKMLEETPKEEIKPAPLLRGEDLIAQGYTPGPVFKSILQSVEDAQLEGRVHNRDEALRLVEEHFPVDRS